MPARFFIDRDAGRPETDLASQQSIDNMRHEIAMLCVLIEERVRLISSRVVKSQLREGVT